MEVPFLPGYESAYNHAEAGPLVRVCVYLKFRTKQDVTEEQAGNLTLILNRPGGGLS